MSSSGAQPKAPAIDEEKAVQCKIYAPQNTIHA